MSEIRFTGTLVRSEEVGPGVLLILPGEASAALPSRGATMVEGTLNGTPFQTVLEPDGNGSHWFKVQEEVLQAAGVDAGDTVAMAIVPTREWREPIVPADLRESLTADAEASAIWAGITASARWDWIRWLGAVKQSETRRRRVESVCSRLKSGKRRPCCFDRNQCTLTDA